MYAENVCESFSSGTLAIAEGTKLCPFLCKLLRCQPARLSKKMKIGKKHFKPQQRSSCDVVIVNHFYSKHKKISELEELFLMEEGQMQGGAARVAFLSHNIQVTWRELFIGFAHRTNQKIINAFQWNELFSQPIDDELGNGSSDSQQLSLPRSPGLGPDSSVDNENGEMKPILLPTQNSFRPSSSLISLVSSVTDVQKLQRDHPGVMELIDFLLKSNATSLQQPPIPSNPLYMNVQSNEFAHLPFHQLANFNPKGMIELQPFLQRPRFPSHTVHSSPVSLMPPPLSRQLSPALSSTVSPAGSHLANDNSAPNAENSPARTSSPSVIMVSQMTPANPLPSRKHLAAGKGPPMNAGPVLPAFPHNDPRLLPNLPLAPANGPITEDYDSEYFEARALKNIEPIPFDKLWDNVAEQLHHAFEFVDVALDDTRRHSIDFEVYSSTSDPAKLQNELSSAKGKTVLQQNDLSLFPQPNQKFQDYFSSFLKIVPFQAADIWVPVMNSCGAQINEPKQKCVLHHAGSFSENSQDTQLKLWGEYSAEFSFEAGVGLPGRVYVSRLPAWKAIDDMNQETFLRLKGATRFGIRTCFAIPVVSCSGLTFVIVFYSQSELVENANVKLFIERTVQSWEFDASYQRDSSLANLQGSSSGASSEDEAPTNVESYEDPLDFF